MGDVATHESWFERTEYYNAFLDGQWTWGFHTNGQAILLDAGRTVRAVAEPAEAPGLVAALNTFEGRNAYAREKLSERDQPG